MNRINSSVFFVAITLPIIAIPVAIRIYHALIYVAAHIPIVVR